MAEDEKFQTHHLDAKATTATFTLPCGLIRDGKVMRAIQLREMSGVEEEILAGKGSTSDRLNRVIANCLVDIAGAKGSIQSVMEMTMIDRLYTLLALRRVSLGDKYMITAQCPSCEKEHEYSIDLSSLSIREMADPSVRAHRGTLPSGQTYAWHVMTGQDEEWVNLVSKKFSGEGLLTIGILARMDELNGARLDKEPVRMREAFRLAANLSLRDRNHLRSVFQLQEGDIDMQLEFACQSCQFEFKADMNIQNKEFFFPLER
jgi:hypothetical protein